MPWDAHMQEFNQNLSKAGARAFMPEDWAASEDLAEATGQLDGLEFPFDSNPIAQRLAAELVHTCTVAWARAEERPVDTRYCPEYDDAQVETLSRLYALSFMDNAAFPLSSPAQHRQVASELLRGIGGCYPPVTQACDKRPSKFLAVRRGEYLCLFKLCRPCREALETLTVDSPEYVGPKEWNDDRTWQFDPFKRYKKNPWSDQLSDLNPPRPVDDDDPWKL